MSLDIATEALRLFPPLILLLREAKAPFSVTTSAGRTHLIPKARAGRTPAHTCLRMEACPVLCRRSFIPSGMLAHWLPCLCH